MTMAPWRHTGRHEGDERVLAPEGVVQVHLEELGKHSWAQALLGAVLGAGNGPVFRFVAAVPGPEHEAAEQAAAAARFPVVPFKDLEDRAQPDEWNRLAHRRLDELGAELEAMGWRRRHDTGPYWWSRRYDAPTRRG